MAAAAEYLNPYNSYSLQQMARSRGNDLKGQSKGKDALVRLLSADLFDAGRIRRALDDLAPV